MIERGDTLLAARGLTDARDRLVIADEPLADLQAACGGNLPGMLAVPDLLDLVRQARAMGLRLAREFSAHDGEEVVSGFVRIHPREESEGGGCELLVENWQRHPRPLAGSGGGEFAEQLDAIDRASAEASGRLDARQRVQLVSAGAPDAKALEQAIADQPGRVWTSYVTLQDIAHRQPMHWRLLDGAHCSLPGSERRWRVRLLPLGTVTTAPAGFEWLLVPQEPLGDGGEGSEEEAAVSGHGRLIGSALTPVLRQPIARIIANAETIRARLAGPLREEYTEYAGTIVAAGQHLSGMLDDLADLEVVEAPGFSTAREKVDLADAARRAGGILGVRAQARDIALDLPGEHESRIATAEFRRVLQVLLNLIGNAIAYSPAESRVTVRTHAGADGRVAVTVADEGPGVSDEQAARIFDKFERLGRDNDGGSGLGLYISRRLARAMGGDLTVAAGEGDGAVFRLDLPAHGNEGTA
ncbi:sensor histidine kinase [Erythrobacter sp. HL-111]|uniref:sensor histidine kinase n=1 Tax=Erythrobacter sp. HL-111 TaxID=1798193 RepID=UPI0006DB2A86|nr:MAG: Histidine kinase-, DNA gyrase B-, and HSP90-like ATPase [Erythrobacteraceae bacterium HL-111]SDS00019.1 Histidine kinase-, DNA gyrase B-, and HSP90-like ATPase [Erythrobacter sp. HL-111]